MANPKFLIKETKNGKYSFHLTAGNGEIILQSQTYADKSGAENGVESVKKNGPDENRYERKDAKDGSPYFVLKAGNGQIIGQSEMYKSTSGRDNGIASVMKNSGIAPTEYAE